MILVKPVPLNDTNFSTTLSENEYAAWSSTTSYAVGNRAVFNHRIYEALAANSGVQPDTDTTKWLDLGATNAYALIDNAVTSKTVSNASYTVTLTLNQVVGTLALLEVTGQSVTVIMTANGTQVYNKTYSLADYGSDDYYDYFFGEIELQHNLILNDLPPYPASTITLTFTPYNGVSECGMLIIGKPKVLGDTQFGLSLGIQDYSKKTRDTFGHYSFIERSYANIGTFDLQVATAKVADIRNTLAKKRATPALYIGDINHPETAIYGIFKTFNIILSNPIVSKCSLKVEGLI